MNIRKSLAVLMLSLFFIVPFSQPVQANPYDLFGEGNCAYSRPHSPYHHLFLYNTSNNTVIIMLLNVIK